MDEGCKADNSSESDNLYPSSVPSQINVRVSESTQISNIPSASSSSYILVPESQEAKPSVDKTQKSENLSTNINLGSNSTISPYLVTLTINVISILEITWTILSTCISWLIGDDSPYGKKIPDTSNRASVVSERQRKKVLKRAEAANQTDPNCATSKIEKKPDNQYSKPSTATLKSQQTQTVACKLEETNKRTLEIDADNNIISPVIYQAVPLNNEARNKLVHRGPVRVVPHSVDPTFLIRRDTNHIANPDKNQTISEQRNQLVSQEKAQIRTQGRNQVTTVKSQDRQQQNGVNGYGVFQFNRPEQSRRVNFSSPPKNNQLLLQRGARTIHPLDESFNPHQFVDLQPVVMLDEKSEKAKQNMRKQWQVSHDSSDHRLPDSLTEENDQNEAETLNHHRVEERRRNPNHDRASTRSTEAAGTLGEVRRCNSPHLNEAYQPGSESSSRKTKSRPSSKRKDENKGSKSPVDHRGKCKSRGSDLEEQSQRHKHSRSRRHTDDRASDFGTNKNTNASSSQKTCYDCNPTSELRVNHVPNLIGTVNPVPHPQFFIPSVNHYIPQLPHGQPVPIRPPQMRLHHPFTVSTNPGHNPPHQTELSLPMDTPLYSLQFVPRGINPVTNQMPVVAHTGVQPQYYGSNPSNGSRSSGGGSSGYLCEDERSEDSAQDRKRRRKSRKKHSKEKKRRSPQDSDDSNSPSN